jgi:hypothetical protein
MFKEMILKLFVGMVINTISVDEIVAAIEKLKLDLQNKVKETDTMWDDMAVAAFLSSEDQVLDLFAMVKELADERVKESTNKTDDILWLPVSQKIGEVIERLKASN